MSCFKKQTPFSFLLLYTGKNKGKEWKRKKGIGPNGVRKNRCLSSLWGRQVVVTVSEIESHKQM